MGLKKEEIWGWQRRGGEMGLAKERMEMAEVDICTPLVGVMCLDGVM